jgi:hypothetical protein
MNHWAVLVAAVSSFLLGGLWYSPMLFGNAWNRENGGVPPAGHPARVFAVALLFSLVAAACFAWWLGPAPSLPSALQAGALAGGGFVAASFGINYQFAQRSFLLWLIDGGYHLLQFLLFGLVLGLWH